MSKIKKTPTEAKRDLENWWFTNWQEFVDIIAEDEEGYLRIKPKKETIFGVEDLGKWCEFHEYGMWVSVSYVDRKPEIVISIS